MENKIENQSVKKSKKAIISLICGITAILVASSMRNNSVWDTIRSLWSAMPSFLSRIFDLGLFLFFYIGTGVLGLIGLILGIKGLKSNRRKTFIWGIVLCVIALLIWVYGIFIYFAARSYYNQ